MRKYKTYKPSEHLWLGTIPEHWNVIPLPKALKSVADFRGKTPRKLETNELGGSLLVTARNIKNGVIDYSLSEEYVDKSEADKLLLRGKPLIGDVLFTTEAPLGEVANIDREDIALAQRVIKFRGNPKLLNNYYLKYWLLCAFFQSDLKCFGTGSTVEGIKGSKLRLLFVLLPELEEQFAIAQYLDAKSQAIDKKINLLTQKANYYKELRKSIINDAVCKGLDKNVKLKESEFIFPVNENWKRYRLKDLGFLYSGLSGKAGDDFNQEENTNSKPFIPFTNIANNTYLDTNQVGSVVMTDNEKQNKVRKGDLFFLMSSEGYEDVGKTAALAEEMKDTYLNSFCKGYRITKNFCEPFFLNYLLLSDNYRKSLITEGKGFTRINLKMEKVTDFFVYLPPTKEEQTAITNYLDEKTQLIDAIVSNIGKQIDTLKELRKTLINDVVTGKIKVVE